jgi:peptide/nickel transport system permease protein
MLRYILRRAIHAFFVVLGVSLLVFVLMRLTGDPVLLLLPSDADREQVESLRRELGLDQPIWIQYLHFLRNAARGDFGTSFRTNQPAMRLVLERLPATLKLGGAALLITIVISLPLGVISATRRDSYADAAGRGVALLGQAVPSFWLGIMLILLFSVKLGWLPAFGAGGAQHLILPAITLGAYSTAITTRLLRSSMLEVLSADYIQTARAKGLSERRVIYLHALRNASLPAVTMLGLQVGVLMGQAVVTEYVFSYPGMGRLVLQAIGNRDFAVVQAFVIFATLTIVAVNLLVDLLYGVLDPRVKYQ